MFALSPGLKLSSVPRVAIVRAPRLQAEPCVTLPLDINNYPMAKFIRCHFKVRAGTSILTWALTTKTCHSFPESSYELDMSLLEALGPNSSESLLNSGHIAHPPSWVVKS